MTDREIECSQTITTENSSSCLRCLMPNLINYLKYIYFNSPCSGLVVSGYSKTQTDKSLETNMAPFLDPYKRFKKMFMVDITGDFKGKWQIKCDL